MTFRHAASLGLTLVALASAQSRLPDGITLQRDIPYVEKGHERQKLDVYASAEGAPRPVVVWIHGGGWEAGDKWYPAPLGALWRGYSIVSVNYRLSGHAPFPAQLDDCQAAIRFVRRHAAKYNLDPKRFAVCGASAGGHLAALVGATAPKETEKDGVDASVHAVIDFCGPTDIGLWKRSRPGDTLSKLIGGPIQNHPDKVRLANPMVRLEKGRETPPFLIIHGDADNVVPIAHSQALETKLKEVGASVQMVTVPKAGHNVTTRPNLDAAFEFLDRELKGKSKSPPAP